MARVTVEECLDVVDNRFELVLVAAKRAHQLSSGGYRTTLETGKDKPTVVALREIEKGITTSAILTEEFSMEQELSAQQKVEDSAKMSEVEQELSEIVIDESSDQMSIKEDG